MIGNDVIFQDLAELIISNPGHRAIIGIGGSVTDQNIDLAKGLAGLVDQALKIFLRRDIGRNSNGRAGMGGIDFSGYLFARTSLTRRNHHLGPMVGHTFRHSPANAARRAGDDGDLTGQIEQVHGLFPNEFFCFKQMLGPAWRQAGGRSSLSG